MAKAREAEQSRIFGVAAHIDAGKTTVSEHMLFLSGVQYRVGLVDEGTATLDFEDMERERGITIHSAAIDLPWRDRKFTLIDTPGHVDFTVEVERCMRVLDGVVLVFDASHGVEAQSETVHRQAVRHGVARIAFLNKLDKVGADWDRSLESLEQRLGELPLSLQLPHRDEAGELALVDLLERRLLCFQPSKGGSDMQLHPWPEEQQELWELERQALVERVAELDEEVLDHFVEDPDVDAPLLQAAIRRLVLAKKVLPVLGGAALRGIGVEVLMDAVGAYLPSPLDIEGPKVKEKEEGDWESLDPDPSAALAAEVFKVVATRHGAVLWLRVYRGTLRDGAQVRIQRSGKVGRVQNLCAMLAEDLVSLQEVGPGRVVSVKGLKDVQTGDALCDPKSPLLFPAWDFPLPVISMAVEARSSEDRDRLLLSLDQLALEDPSMHWRQDEDTGQILISGMGELHLQILSDRLRQAFRLDVVLGAPRVAMRESIQVPCRIQKSYTLSFPGGVEAHATLDVSFRPDPELEHAQIRSEIPEDLRKTRAGMELEAQALRALSAEMSAGIRHGYPVTQLDVCLHRLEGRDGQPPKLEDVDIVVSALVRDLAERSQPQAMEPWMRLSIQVPEDKVSPVLGDIQAHEGEVSRVEVEAIGAEIQALAPLSRMLDFTTRLRSLTGGRGACSMQLDRYRPALRTS